MQPTENPVSDIVKPGTERFPANLFVLYVFLYSGLAVYASYVNLYLSGTGLSQAQIGLIVTISTAVLLIFQPLWGLASDRARFKNSILKILYACTALAALLFYTTEVYWQIVAIIALFSLFFFAIMPLQDNLSLEYLENSKWDFGRVRLGGTLGYAVTVLLVGYWLQDNYSRIFILVSVIFFVCLIVIQFTPKVSGHRRGERKAPIRDIFRNPAMVCLIVYNLLFSLGFNIFYNYYPIYFASIGANSTFIGAMLFISAMAELPFLLTARRWISRLGIEKVLVIAGLATSLRWFLLFMLTDHMLIVMVNLLNGMGFVTVNYCLVVFINANMPRELRATGQSLNAGLMTFFSRIVFGYVGGLASDVFGVNIIMLIIGISTVLATVLFIFWFQAVKQPQTVTSV